MGTLVPGITGISVAGGKGSHFLGERVVVGGTLTYLALRKTLGGAIDSVQWDL